MRRFHLLAGTLGLLAFAGEGVYMVLRFPGAYHGDPTMHMMFRSAHVYLLFGALLNLTLGLHAQPSAVRGRLQAAGSALVLAAPAILLFAFVLEPAPGRLSRPFAGAGAGAAFLGVMLHWAAARGRRPALQDDPAPPPRDSEPRRDSRAPAAV
jgi:hypothetical protein